MHTFDPISPSWDFIPRMSFFERQKATHESFKFHWFGCYTISVPKSTSDGMTVPFFAEMMTLRRITAFGPGVVPAMLHDNICANPSARYYLPASEIYENHIPHRHGPHVIRELSRKERALIFKHALDVRPAGIYNDIIWKSVKFGSEYLGYC